MNTFCTDRTFCRFQTIPFFFHTDTLNISIIGPFKLFLTHFLIRNFITNDNNDKYPLYPFKEKRDIYLALSYQSSGHGKDRRKKQRQFENHPTLFIVFFALKIRLISPIFCTESIDHYSCLDAIGPSYFLIV